MFNVYLHGSSRKVEVKGRYYVGMEDSQPTNQIASYMYLGTAAWKVGGVYETKLKEGEREGGKLSNEGCSGGKWWGNGGS